MEVLSNLYSREQPPPMLHPNGYYKGCFKLFTHAFVPENTLKSKILLSMLFPIYSRCSMSTVLLQLHVLHVYSGVLMLKFSPLALKDNQPVSLCTVTSRPQRGDRHLPCERRPPLSAEVPVCWWPHQGDVEQRGEAAWPRPALRSGGQGRGAVVSKCADVP